MNMYAFEKIVFKNKFLNVIQDTGFMEFYECLKSGR